MERFVFIHACEHECDIHQMGIGFLGISLHSLLDGVALNMVFSAAIGNFSVVFVIVHRCPIASFLQFIRRLAPPPGSHAKRLVRTDDPGEPLRITYFPYPFRR